MEIEGYGGVEIDDTYAVHLKLPIGDRAFCIEASASDNLKSFDIIIGMDAIGFGDFCETLSLALYTIMISYSLVLV